MRRREFIIFLGNSAAVWPVVARSQQAIRRVAVVLGFAQDDQQGQIRLAAFVDALARLGWNDGRNVKLDIHWAGGNVARYKAVAAEVANASPDVVVAMTNPFVAQLQPITKTIPIVFTQVSDSVGAGFVNNITHPGGNITGFENFLGDIGSKWLALLKEAAPAITLVGIVLDPDNSSLSTLRKAIEAAAPKLGVQTVALAVHAATDIDNAINTFAMQQGSGLIVLANPVTIQNRDRIIMLAARHRLPAVYMFRYFASSGGLIAYGIDQLEQWRGAAGYVDRILKGEKPGDLPVQAPSKYELVVNLKTSRALGLSMPQTLLARADEVIE